MNKLGCLVLVVLLAASGCVVDKQHRKQQININIVVRGIDVRDPVSRPGTAEIGSSYSVAW